MASWATTTLHLKELCFLPVAPSRTLGGTPCCTTCHLKSFDTERKGRYCSYVTHKSLKGRARVVDSRLTSVHSNVGVWEDPDDGSGSEFDDDDDDDDEEQEESDLDFESDWEEDKDSSVATIDEQRTAIKYEEELAKEVEHLLEPGELAILQQNTSPNLEKISTEKWSPLHTFALSGQIHFIDQLLENGVSIDIPDKDGRTALHASIIGKKESVVTHLLRKGANPHVTDENGVSTLHYAVQASAIQTVKLLIKYNVDVNVSDNEGWTPLHVAMQTRNKDIAKVLLVNGADTMRKNKDGKTPLDMSLAYGKEFKSYDLVKMLKVIPANRVL